MKRSLILLVFLSAAGPALATAQQERMKACNADATTQNLTGDARKDFMKECLSAKKAESGKALTPQQEKMKTCNADAKKQGLKGSARKDFMKTCLSKQAPAPAAETAAGAAPAPGATPPPGSPPPAPAPSPATTR